MITIPTGDLTGLLADVIPFAYRDEDFPLLNAVHMSWDGEHLHAQATDRYRTGWATWSPDDEHNDDAQPDLFSEWGGADDDWSIVIPLADARDLVTVFKLPAKEWAVPLTIDVFGGRITIDRGRETGHSALKAVVNAVSMDHGTYPDLEEQLAKIEANTAYTDSTVYTAKLLADFAKVRAHGPLELTFAGRSTLVRIGTRFRGAIANAKPAEDTASSLLRDGVGLINGASADEPED